MPEITWERTNNGYQGWNGEMKVAVLSTKHNLGLAREGRIVMEAQPREHWGIHFTAPAMSVVLVKAIIDSLPEEA